MEKVIKPETSLRVVLATIVLLGCVVGGIGYVLGRDSAEPAQAKIAERSPGGEELAAAREAGYDRGFAAGKKAAERDSEQSDRPSPRDALSAGGFDLDPGSYYIVRVAEGHSGKPAIADYAALESGVGYRLCDAYGVCRVGP